MRLAAVGDLHFSKSSGEILQPVFSEIGRKADVLLLCGDLIDYGLPEEAAMFAKELSSVKIPVIAVLGNLEFESGKQDEVRRILSDGGATVLDGDVCEMRESALPV